MNTRKRLGSLLGIICTLLLALGLMGCPPEDNGGDINGTWTCISSYGTDTFTVNGNTFSYAYVDNGNPSYNSSYSGTIENSSNRTDTSGFLTIKLTSVGGTASATLGHYARIGWKDLTASSVLQSAGGKMDPDPNWVWTKTSQADAENIITEANGFFNWGILAPFTKQ